MKVQRFSVLFVILGLLTIITGRAQAQMITMRQAFISDDVIASQQFLSHSAGQPAWPANAGHLLAISDDGDNAAIGYATGGDRTLIRWFWSNESDSPIFRVYRQTDGGPETMVAEVTPVTTPATAINFLNTTDPRWPNLYADLLDQFGPEGVVDIPSFHDFMDNNKFAAQQLANERYPVALVIGRGYLDLDVVPGSTYTYRVEAVRAETVTLGSVTLVAGQLTPLDKPTGLSAVFLGAGSDHVRSQEGDWATAQQNRRFDQTVYLAWDAGKTGDDFPAAWVTGYDIYRAPTGSPDAFVQVNGDLAVQPMPATVPVSETDPSDDALAYELISYYYADNPPEYGDWSYRVAPRDLLGQVRQWPDNAAQFSAAITATAYDFLPPPAPSDLVVEVPASNDQVVLTWSMTPTDDLAGFRIERTLTLNAESEPGGCFTDTDCWKEAATVAGDALTWTDTDATLETVRWYRVQAVDHFGNRSLFAGPVQAVIHDIDPPPPPQIRVGHCDPTGSDKDGDCITGGGSADTTRIRIYCKFSTDGSELPVAEVAGNSLDAFDLTTVYTPPLTLEDVVCRARAADAHGNLSGFSNAVTLELFPLTPPEAPQPIITDVETIAGGSAGWTGQVKWEMVDIPGLVGFRIAREDQSADPPSVVTFTVGPDARDYSDATVEPSKTYIYTVTAIFEPGFYNVAETTSLPRTFRVVAEGQRPLTEIGWVHINFTAGTGTQLEWECSECELQRTPWWAVFRSVHRDADYIQLTPVLNAGPAYTDTSAQHNRYWYVIVEFDPRTGEPIRYTRPNSVAHGLAPLSPSDGGPLSAVEVTTTVKLDGWEASLFSIASTENRELAASGIGACKPVPVDRRQPLRFGDGFEVHSPVFTSLDPKNLAGRGLLRVTPPRRVIDIPVTFSGITVGDRRNHVCSGSLSVDVVTDLGSPIRVQFPGGLRYAVYQIVAQPWFDTPNDGAGDVRLHLPDTLRRVYSPPAEGDDIALPASLTKLHSDLSFDFSYDFASNPAHTCTTPIVAFNLETLPTTVVPLGLFTADETGITIESSCMRYLERYSGALGPRPTPPSATAADSNDGFLRGTFTGGLTTITGSGLGGNFATHDDMSWIASYPWGFNLTVHAVEVLLDKSQIVAGGFGNGSVTMAYQQTISESTTGVVSAGFDNMTVDPRGAAVTALATSDPVSWLIPGGFTMKAGDWELYLGTVTTAGRPQTAMWRTRPDDAKEVGLPLPAELDPGFNRRLSSTPLLWANCSGPAATFDAAADTYLRHGGVSQRQKAKLTAMVDLSIHGYEAGIDTLDLAFLDNYIWDRNVTGEIRLPFPPAISLRLIDMWFNDDGCIGGGSVPAGEGDKTLKFWQIVAHIKAVEFRDNPEFSTADEAWDAMLWAIGALDLPHVAPPGSSSIATIDIEAAFRPDGSFYSSQLIHDRPDYSFDGFPLLLEQVDLSAVGATPDWQSDATIATPPSNDWSARGYVDLEGAFVSPYFGTLLGPEGQPRPEVRILGWDDYVGFTRHPRVEKVWVDLDVVNLTYDYGRLVYGHDRSQHRGMFVGFESYELAPEPLPASTRVLDLETSAIIEPDEIGVYLGLSAGTAAFRAMAETTQTDLSSPPDATTRSTWGSKLAMDHVTEYGDLLTTVWSQYSDGKTFRDTTQVLDDYDTASGQDLPNEAGFGGNTKGQLDDWGVKVKRIRGDVVVEVVEDGTELDIQFDRFLMSSEVTVERSGEEEPLFHAEILDFEINRHGDFIMQGTNVTSSLYESDLTLDATLRINPKLPQFEGGLTLHGFDISDVHVKQGTAVLGVGADLNYVGANFDASLESSPGGTSVKLGGALLFGTIDPASPVLKVHFSDLTSKLAEVPSSPSSSTPATTLDGLYLRAYGDFPIYSNGCMLEVNVGGEVAVWYWAAGGGSQTYGGKIRGYVYGDVLCVVSARGDLTLLYWVTPDDVKHFEGASWVAGGIGRCDPEDWDSWESRWWGDSWCWTAGAYFHLTYTSGGDDWQVDYYTDTE